MRNFVVMVGVITGTVLTPPAWAGEAEDLASGIKCKDLKGVIKMAQKFDKFKADKTDTVSAVPDLWIVAKEGGKMPKRLYYRNGSSESDFTFTKDGHVTDFARIQTMDKKGEICLQSPEYIGQKKGKSGVGMSLNIEVLYKNKSGHHTIAELWDGARDGKSHYKKLYPGPLAVMVPKMTHVAIAYKENEKDKVSEENATNKKDILKADALEKTHNGGVYATKAGEKILGLVVEEFAGMYVVDIAALEKMGADGLAVSGGAYTMTPTPSIEKMKKLGFADDDEASADAVEKTSKNN